MVSLSFDSTIALQQYLMTTTYKKELISSSSRENYFYMEVTFFDFNVF